MVCGMSIKRENFGWNQIRPWGSHRCYFFIIFILQFFRFRKLYFCLHAGWLSFYISFRLWSFDLKDLTCCPFSFFTYSTVIYIRTIYLLVLYYAVLSQTVFIWLDFVQVFISFHFISLDLVVCRSPSQCPSFHLIR